MANNEHNGHDEAIPFYPLRSEKDRERQEAFNEANNAERAALAPPEIEGMPSWAVGISYRDALDRVRRLSDTQEIADVMEQAVVTDDRLLGKATLYRAIELESNVLISAYLSEYPEDGPALAEFQKKARAYRELIDDGRTAV